MQLFWIGFFYASFFAFVGLYSPFLGPYLKSIGHSLDVIALSLGMMQIMRMFGPLLWGWLADHTGRRVFLLRLSVAGALVMAGVTFINDQSVVHLVICLVLLNLCTSGMVPMSDVLAMEACAGQTGSYGKVRLFGSLGFIVAVLGFGFWAEHLGFSAFPLWALLCLALTLWSTLRFKQQPLVKTPHSDQALLVQPMGILDLMRGRDLQLFWIASFLMVLAHGVFYGYFSLYLQEYDYSASVIGFLWTVGVLLEVLFFAFQTRIFERMGRLTWLVWSYLACVIRFGLVASFPELLWVLVLAQCGHALTFAAHHTATITWLRERLPQQVHGRAQALYATIAYGLGGTSGTVLGKWAWGAFSPSAAFYLAAVAGAIALVFGILLWLQHQSSTQHGVLRSH